MLTIKVPMVEGFNQASREFVPAETFTLQLEHSLLSLSKWESEFEKPFLTAEKKTAEEVLGYVKAMTLTSSVPSEVYMRLSEENVREIDAYISSKMTATWFTDNGTEKRDREVITSELIYYWMFSSGIDKQCELWHLNRLFTLIKVFNEKNKAPKKMTRAEIAQQHRTLNEQRRAKMGTSG